MNVAVTVKVSLRIRACGKGSWAVRGFPSCSRIRQQCGQTLHSALFFQMCLVLNSTSHNRECSEGLTVNGLQVITPPHNMYCTGTQGAGYFSHTNKMMTHITHARTHTHASTHARTHAHTHTHRGQYQPRMMWTIVHTRLPSPECDLHVTSMSPSCMWHWSCDLHVT